MVVKAAGGQGDPPNPWVFPFPDNNDPPRSITISFVYDAVSVNRDILSATVTRDAGCQWRKVYVGLGPDGRPNTTDKVFNVGNFEGTVQFTQAELRHPKINLRTVADVKLLQITAGP